jgi:hypothetical protein
LEVVALFCFHGITDFCLHCAVGVCPRGTTDLCLHCAMDLSQGLQSQRLGCPRSTMDLCLHCAIGVSKTLLSPLHHGPLARPRIHWLARGLGRPTWSNCRKIYPDKQAGGSLLSDTRKGRRPARRKPSEEAEGNREAGGRASTNRLGQGNRWPVSKGGQAGFTPKARLPVEKMGMARHAYRGLSGLLIAGGLTQPVGPGYRLAGLRPSKSDLRICPLPQLRDQGDRFFWDAIARLSRPACGL